MHKAAHAPCSGLSPTRPQGIAISSTSSRSSSRRTVVPLAPLLRQRGRLPPARFQDSNGSSSSSSEALRPALQELLTAPLPVPAPAASSIAPAPSNTQASVQLVPKRGREALVLGQQQLPAEPEGALNKFMLKFKLAWQLFFPPASSGATTPMLTPKDLGKQRLSMILVADRCGLSPTSLIEMKKNTVKALADVMDLEDLQDANLRFTMTREGGTTYSMAVPILRPAPFDEDDAADADEAPQATQGFAGASYEDDDGRGTYATDNDDGAEHWEYQQQYGQRLRAAATLQGKVCAAADGGADDVDCQDGPELVQQAGLGEMQQQQQLDELDAAGEASLAAAVAAVTAAAEAGDMSAAAVLPGAAPPDERELAMIEAELKELFVEEAVEEPGDPATCAATEVAAGVSSSSPLLAEEELLQAASGGLLCGRAAGSSADGDDVENEAGSEAATAHSTED